VKLAISSIALLLLLLGIWVRSYSTSYWLLLPSIAILIVISYSFIGLKIHEKRCFVSCYIESDTLLSRFMLSRVSTTIFYIVTSILMTLSALYSTIDYSLDMWIYLPIHAIIATLLYRYLNHKFVSTISSSYLQLFAREWTIYIMTIPLIGVYLYISIYGYEPSYLAFDFSQTLQQASSSIYSISPTVDTILKTQREIDGAFWWLMDRGSSYSSDSDMRLLVWLGFLLLNSFAILGINRLAITIIYILDRLFDHRSRGV